MLRHTVLVFLFIACSLPVLAGEFQPLYPNAPVRDAFRNMGPERVRIEEQSPASHSRNRRIFSQVSEPVYKTIPAEKAANTGVAVVLFPGGGFVDVWLDKEGTDIAWWLSKHGIASMIVKYSTSSNADGKETMSFATYQEIVRQDTARAMVVMREHSRQLGVDPDRIGMMGFSAGAVAVQWHLFHKKEDGGCCTVDMITRPAFAALIYGGGYGDKQTNPPLALLDDPGNLPPVYMAAARDDEYVDFGGYYYFRLFYDLIEKVPNSELHIYGRGGHGFALDKRGHSVSTWLDTFYLWLQDLGMFTAS